MQTLGVGTIDKCTSLETLFKKINRAYEAQGYQMPRLVFWNICSRTNTVPLQQNEAGVALISGFSPAVYQMVLSMNWIRIDACWNS